jgi:hypothetical protein
LFFLLPLTKNVTKKYLALSLFGPLTYLPTTGVTDMFVFGAPWPMRMGLVARCKGHRKKKRGAGRSIFMREAIFLACFVVRHFA